METIRLSILAAATVLAWSAASHLLPSSWPAWGYLAASTAAGAILAVPFAYAVGVDDRKYAWFAVAMIVGVPVAERLLGGISGREWITAVVLLVALAGLIGQRMRRHST